MSFLSSHRLHWGAHHEIMENLRQQIDNATNNDSMPHPTDNPALHGQDSHATNEKIPHPSNWTIDDRIGP